MYLRTEHAAIMSPQAMLLHVLASKQQKLSSEQCGAAP